MVDIDTAIGRLEKALGTLREARRLMSGGTNGHKVNKPKRAYRTRRRVTPEESDRIRTLHNSGLSIYQIANTVKRSFSVVNRHIRRAPTATVGGVI